MMCCGGAAITGGQSANRINAAPNFIFGRTARARTRPIFPKGASGGARKTGSPLFRADAPCFI
jgi:hypothetical protein